MINALSHSLPEPPWLHASTLRQDAELIRAVYAERGRDDGAAYFGRSSEAVRAGVMNRFRNEERDALQMLGE